jgi:hypothetical protein
VYGPGMGQTQRDQLYGDWKRAVERTFKWAR